MGKRGDSDVRNQDGRKEDDPKRHVKSESGGLEAFGLGESGADVGLGQYK